MVRPAASSTPSTGDLPEGRSVRVVSFVNEPNDFRKPVTWQLNKINAATHMFDDRGRDKRSVRYVQRSEPHVYAAHVSGR